MIYLRREVTNDGSPVNYCNHKDKRDLVAYSDPDCTIEFHRWPWHLESRPGRGKPKKLVINGQSHETRWLPDLPYKKK